MEFITRSRLAASKGDSEVTDSTHYNATGAGTSDVDLEIGFEKLDRDQTSD